MSRRLLIALACASALMMFGVAAKAGVGMSFFWLNAPGGASAAAPTCLLNFSTYVCAGGLN